MKEAMGLQHSWSKPAQGQQSLLKPCSETHTALSLQGRREGTARTSRDHLGAPQHNKSLVQAGPQHRSKAGCVLQQ